jgi:hypothetical protein
MLFVADQHDLYNLEQFVIRFGSKYLMRLSGDISPSIPVMNLYDTDHSLSHLKRFQQEFKAKKGLKETVELTYAQKVKAHEEGIMGAGKDRFLELTALYGAASIFNLARKFVIHKHSTAGKTICLAGNEIVMDHAQRIIYQRIIQNNNIPEDGVMGYVWEAIEGYGEEKYGLKTIILDLLSDAEIKENGRQFILTNLSRQNYGGDKIPTCLDVFKEHPHFDNFEFIEQITVERKGNCVVVHVPYFTEEGERYQAEDFAKGELKKILAVHGKGIPIINYHGNPNPEKMDCESVRERSDYNILVIKAVTNSVIDVAAYDRDINMICSHLHKSNKDYSWSDYPERIRIYPLGTDDYAQLDPGTGAVTVSKFH